VSNKKNILVSIIMGSQSDWEFVKPASKILKGFSIRCIDPCGINAVSPDFLINISLLIVILALPEEIVQCSDR